MTTIQISFERGNNNKEFNSDQKDFLLQTAQILSNAINSDKFKKDVENFSYLTRLRRRKSHFRMNNGYSRKQIYMLILSGKDNFEKEEDNVINFILRPYKEALKYHAYTNPSSKDIYINKTYIKYCINLEKKTKAFSKMADTLIHEYMHNLGFNHKTNKPSKYNNSTVPWAIGTIVKTIIRKN